ncbi:11377_t:CDS:10 [Entrophospora sp. SA101]|nr:11377_t:CDS:10 [Entrophospora sp. SA101]
MTLLMLYSMEVLRVYDFPNQRGRRKSSTFPQRIQSHRGWIQVEHTRPSIQLDSDSSTTSETVAAVTQSSPVLIGSSQLQKKRRRERKLECGRARNYYNLIGEYDEFASIKEKWDVIFKDPLLSLTSLREKAIKGNVCSQSLRSVCWKLYLSYLPSPDISTWTLTLHKERQHYADLRQKYITNPNTESDNDIMDDLTVNNPLSLDQANPWQEYFKDTELRKIIKQDVERTFPDNEYFRTPETQSRLLDILFIYCKMNTDVSYRQGMHELLAPILWVVDHESISGADGFAMENSEDSIIKQTLNSDYVEHDSFVLFSALMKAAKLYYEYNDEIFNHNARLIKEAQNEVAKLTPVVVKCNKIFNEYLKTFDFELYEHLSNLEIEPQLYGIRWIRLLFGREFPLNKVLILWDGMFAEDPTLRIVDFVCIAMILHIRDELLESDFTGCLSMLMTYPPIDDVQLLVPQAIHLRDHLSPEGGAYIISENALRVGKPLPAPYQVYEHSRSESIVPDGFVHVTKNVLESRSAAVLNKAILTAVGEVKKNVLRRSDIQQNYDGRKQTHSELSKLREQNHNFSIVVNQNRLKYMRDVLNGTLKDSSQNFDVNYNHNGPEDHDHWEVVDDGVSVVSVAGTEDETAFVSKESKFVPSSSNSSTVNSNVGSKSMINNNHIQTKRLPSPPLPPLPPPLSNSIQQKQSPASVVIPKSRLKLEDILNDVDNDSPTGFSKSSIASNSKYSWMIEGCIDEDDNSLFNPKRSSIASINSLSSFASLNIENYIDDESFKKSPFPLIATSTTTSNSINSGKVDPLGATTPNSSKVDVHETSEAINNARKSNYTASPAAPVDDPLGLP